MNNPTTRTEQMLATASNGVSFLSISVEAGRSSEHLFSLIVLFMAHDKTSKYPLAYRSEWFVGDTEVSSEPGSRTQLGVAKLQQREVLPVIR